MGVLTEGNIRVSLPGDCVDADIDRFLEILPGAVAAVRAKLDAPSATPSTDELTLDTLGRRCPIPVIELAKHLADVPVGGLIRVLSDDEAAALDIPAWCEMRAQEYVGSEPTEGLNAVAYLIRRLS
jgi:cysteine desulfurase